MDLYVSDEQIESMIEDNLQIKEEYIEYTDNHNINIISTLFENLYVLDFEYCWFADSDRKEKPSLIFELRDYKDIEYPCRVESRECKYLKGSITKWEDDVINEREDHIYTNGEYEVGTYSFLTTKEYNHIGKNIKEIKNIRSDLIDASWLFSECWYAEDSSFFPYIHAGNIDNMSYMYYNCARLKELDLSDYDTRKVKDMSHMFDTCAYLEVLKLSNFNMDLVENTDCMFMQCIKLRKLYLDDCKRDTIQKIIESSYFPCDDKILVTFDSEVRNLIINGDSGEPLELVNNNLQIPENYVIYHVEERNLELTDVTAERIIYCKQENAIGLTAPGNWRFKYI